LRGMAAEDASPRDVKAGLLSLRALARGLLGVGLATCAVMLATGNPLALQLAPTVLAVAAVACGVAVFMIDPAPKARWRGLGASAILTGALAVLVQVGVLG